jgi:PadR family transcriptional regulator PadR
MATRPEPDQPDNWERQVKKGWLELAILASLWGEKLYGLEILRRLEEGTDLVVAEGTVYPILSRLKAEGLVETKWVDGDSGHPRKYYWLTPVGRSRATTMARYASGFLGSISQIIAPLLAKEKRG